MGNVAQQPSAMSGWRLFGAVALLASLAVFVTLACFGTDEPGIRAVVRLTARLSVLLFASAFVASALSKRWPNRPTRWLLAQRRYLGVSFAYSHFLHLVALFLLASLSADFRANLSTVTLAGGGLAYIFIALMTATSFDRSAAWIGARRWRALHKVGGYYIWVLFAQSYVPRALGSPAYMPVAALLLLVLVLRLLPPPARLAERPRA